MIMHAGLLTKPLWHHVATWLASLYKLQMAEKILFHESVLRVKEIETNSLFTLTLFSDDNSGLIPNMWISCGDTLADTQQKVTIFLNILFSEEVNPLIASRSFIKGYDYNKPDWLVCHSIILKRFLRKP